MSWGIKVTGTKAGAARVVSDQLNACLKSYTNADGTPTEEGKDILAAKDRILSLIAAMGDKDYRGLPAGVLVDAHGSRSGDFGGNFKVEVSMVPIGLD